MSKELYIAELERLMADEDMSYEEAGDKAYDRMRERLADKADAERKRRREDAR